MTRKTVCMAVVLVLVTTLLSFGQSKPEELTLDLKSALELTTQNYPSIKSKVAEKEAASYALKAVQTNYLPNFIVQGQVLNSTSNQVRGTYYSNEGAAISISGSTKVNGNTNDAVWTSFATGMINWKLFSFGKYRAAVDEGRAGLAATEADYKNEVFQQQIKVADTYLFALMLEDLVKSQRANLKRLKALKDVTTAYTRSGLRPGVDSSLVNAEYSKGVLLFLEATRLAAEQNLQVRESVGMTGHDKINLDTTVFLKQVPPQIEITNSVAQNPQLIFFQSLVNVNATRVKSIKLSELPSISLLAAGWGRGSGILDKPAANGDFIYDKSFNAGVPLRAYDYMIGFSTIWNITSLFKTGQEAKAQGSAVKIAEERYNEESLKVESDLQRAKLRYEAAIEVARQAPIQLNAAQDAFNQAKARYEAGMSTILEMTQTFALLNRAEVDVSAARANVWRAILQYAAASGDFEVFMNNLN